LNDWDAKVLHVLDDAFVLERNLRMLHQFCQVFLRDAWKERSIE
jgi:hypothetical protein